MRGKGASAHLNEKEDGGERERNGKEGGERRTLRDGGGEDSGVWHGLKGTHVLCFSAVRKGRAQR